MQTLFSCTNHTLTVNITFNKTNVCICRDLLVNISYNQSLGFAILALSFLSEKNKQCKDVSRFFI